jgi:peptidoglycan/xylan/chitin deacetylase (PgdA/CDA1 family)
MIVLTTAALALAGTATYFSPLALRLGRIWYLRKQITRDRLVALTYDDGPSATVTPRLLDLLRSYNAKATFFMLGRSAQQYPHIADRVLAEGHDVGCHSNQHLNAWNIMPWTAIADINAGYKSLAPWVDPNGSFRPPHGKMTFPTFWAVRRRGAEAWWWTIDAGDTFAVLPRPRDVADRVLSDGGGIILMHDLDRSEERNKFVLDTSALLLDLAQRESFRIAPLRQL